MNSMKWKILLTVGLLGFFTAAEMNFESHVLFKEGGGSWAQNGTADFDKDGLLDFTSGQNGVPTHWFRNTGDITQGWEKQALFGKLDICVGGDPYDVDEDGWMDWVTAGWWFRNTGDPINKGFEKKPWNRQKPARNTVTVSPLPMRLVWKAPKAKQKLLLLLP